jgi:hypothetical protein
MGLLATRLQSLATRVATECKSIRLALQAKVGDLTSLATVTKSNLVEAINEVRAAAVAAHAAAQAAATIDDNASASSAETWSINKIIAELETTAAAVRDQILGGAGAAFDTLTELQALLEGDAAELAGLATAIGNRVRFDAAQALTTDQKAQARTNIGAVGTGDIGDPDQDLVAVFEAGLA